MLKFQDIIDFFLAQETQHLAIVVFKKKRKILTGRNKSKLLI